MKNINIHTGPQAATNYQIETRMLNGRQHIVVPVIMMREGVHSGSRGPLFHSASELGRVVAAWNGIPITIHHPQSGDGFVSANSPDQLERAVGRVFNARMDGDRLRAEAWIELEKIRSVSPQALAYIQQRRPLDVSVGVFNDEVPAENGVWNNEPYTAIATNHRPDHLALLPGDTGACSWNDGCGIRVNSMNNKTQQNVNMEVTDNFAVFKGLNKDGFAIAPVVNAVGMREMVDKARGLIDAMDNEQRVYYLEELYEDHLIYRVRYRNNTEEHVYRQNYTTDDSGVMTFEGAPIEVRKQVEYVTMQMQRTKFNNNQKTEKDMNANLSPCRLAKIDQIIANKATQFGESDRALLATFGEDVLDKILPTEQTPPQQAAPTLDVNAAIAAVKASIAKPEDVLNLVPAEMKAQMEQGLQLYSAHIASLTEAILAGTDQFSKEELSVMNVNMLEKLAKATAPKQVDQQTQELPMAANGQFVALGANSHSGKPESEAPMMPMGYSQKKS